MGLTKTPRVSSKSLRNNKLGVPSDLAADLLKTASEKRRMLASANPASYRIEVSGWDADENFFVEKADLEWRAREKKVSLQHPIREGAMVFIRLLGTPLQNSSNPVAFEAIQIDREENRSSYAVSLRPMKPHVRTRTTEPVWIEAQKEEVL